MKSWKAKEWIKIQKTTRDSHGQETKLEIPVDFLSGCLYSANMKSEQFLTDLENALEVQSGSIKLTDSINELGCWDSMAVLSFMALADEKLQVSVSAGDIPNCKTVKDLLGLLGDKIEN